MKVSIVTATYNRKGKLPRVVRSVLGQSYKDLELIIVDDGSTDGTEGYLREKLKDERVRYVKLPENCGASVARNKGIEEARGEYILIWDSDDELYPEALETVAKTFDKHSEAGIVSAPAVPFKGGKELSFRERPEGFVSLSRVLCKYLPNNEKVRVARSGIMKQVKYRSKNIDFMVNGYLAEKGRWYHLNQPLGKLNVLGDDSLTRSRKKRDTELSIERAPYLEKYLDHFREVLIEHCPGRYAAYAYGASVGFLLSGGTQKARHWSKEALLYENKARHYGVYVLSRAPAGGVLLSVLFKFF